MFAKKEKRIDCKVCRFSIGEAKQLHDFEHGFVEAKMCSKTGQETYDCGCFGCEKGEEINRNFLCRKLIKIYRKLFNQLFCRKVKVQFVGIQLPLVKSELPKLPKF